MWKSFTPWLDVPSTDPDDARRRKLLNILLAGMAALVLVALLATTIARISGYIGAEDAPGIQLATLGTLAGIVVVYLINRYLSGMLASILFLLLLAVALAYADQPQEVVDGRSLFVFVIPILMASVLLRPWASFVLAGVVSLEITFIALNIGFVPPVPTMLGFFVIAMVSWLAARSLERALVELRLINRELDQRVEERTRDLAEALGRNQAILEGIADGVIVFNTIGQAVVANPAVSELLERPLSRIVGYGIEALMGDQVSVPEKELVLNLIKDTDKRYPSLKLEWGAKTLSVSFAPVRDTEERVTGTVAVFRDFTREAEVERMKSAFVSMVSHELRTPLGGIIGYTEMLKEEHYGPLSNKQKEIMERIMVNARQQLGLVDDLLDRARLEAGRLTLEVSTFSPAELLGEVVDVTSVLAQNRGIALTTYLDPGLPSALQGDPKRLKQILLNLTGNAIKFTDEGEVHIRLTRPDERHWAMAVIDTGPGIPEEAQTYIFEPFRQVDGSATRSHGGAGLGLSIVKQFAILMGGSVDLVSKVGRGSAFTVTLPIVQVPERERVA